eukprot:6233110-Amphidinium_carterae.1
MWHQQLQVHLPQKLIKTQVGLVRELLYYVFWLSFCQYELAQAYTAQYGNHASRAQLSEGLAFQEALRGKIKAGGIFI